RAGSMGALLVVELLALTLRFDTRALSESAYVSGVWVGYAPALLQIDLAATAVFALFVTCDLPAWRALQQQAGPAAWPPWLGAHFAALAAFTGCFAVIVAPDFPAWPAVPLWLVGWGICGLGTLACGLLAVAPLPWWRQVVRRQGLAFVVAGVLGV